MTKTRQVAQRAKVEGGGVGCGGLGGCDWVLLVCLLMWDRPSVLNQKDKPKGWAPPFCRVGKVASGDQD